MKEIVILLTVVVAAILAAHGLAPGDKAMTTDDILSEFGQQTQRTADAL